MSIPAAKHSSLIKVLNLICLFLLYALRATDVSRERKAILATTDAKIDKFDVKVTLLVGEFERSLEDEGALG
jgi:hypothetical protein